jgi:hypothetical protein
MCSRGAGVKEPAARDYILKGPFTDLMVLSPNERLRNYGRPARAIEVAAEHDISGRPRVAVVVVRSRLLEALMRDPARDKCLTKSVRPMRPQTRTKRTIWTLADVYGAGE